MKDNDEEHFEFVHHNVIVEDSNNAKLEYVKFGKIHLKNMVSLPHNNILQRAHGLLSYDEDKRHNNLIWKQTHLKAARNA